MHVRRIGSRFARAFLVLVWAAFALVGCSREEELVPDAGASPFYPGPSDPKKASTQPEKAEPKGVAQSEVTLAKADAAGSSALDSRFGTNDIERQLRIAQRAARNGDSVAAAQMLDQVLAIEPIHREALIGRAGIALEQSRQAKSLDEKAATVAKAAELVRSLFRAYDSPKPHEKGLFAGVLYRQAQVMTEKGQLDQAVNLLTEISDSGIDAFARAENDESLATLRPSPQFLAAQKADDDSRLAKARERTKGQLAPPLAARFDFTLADFEGKKVSLGDFAGKVVLVDFWGTWCGPCRKTIPQLIDLYKKRRHRGLEIVGLSYERDAQSESDAREMAKKFVREAGIPYTCLLGDEATLRKVPGFKGFPTSVVVDRAGKVRLFMTENDEHSMELIDDVVRVLLAEPVPTGDAAPKAAAAAKGPGAPQEGAAKKSK